MGKKEYSDPYLHIRLGNKVVLDDRNSAQQDKFDLVIQTILNSMLLIPSFSQYLNFYITKDLYKMVEFDVVLPGSSLLKISMMDKNSLGFDGLIGSTIIDLEDRWYSSFAIGLV